MLNKSPGQIISDTISFFMMTWKTKLEKIVLTYILVFLIIIVGGFMEIMVCDRESMYRYWIVAAWIIVGCIGAMIEIWRNQE